LKNTIVNCCLNHLHIVIYMIWSTWIYWIPVCYIFI